MFRRRLPWRRIPDSNGLNASETRIFKSPSLKNVAAGGPHARRTIFHAGRSCRALQLGVRVGPALDNRLRVGQGAQPRQLNLAAGQGGL